MKKRWPGIFLFLPVPVVLWLITVLPLGMWLSLGLGVAFMATHRLYARPYALVRAEQRCLWCGRVAEGEPLVPLAVTEPIGEIVWRVCAGRHKERLTAFLGWASRKALFLKVGIAGTLLAYLVTVPLASFGKLGPVEPGDLAAGFRLLIALAVLPLGWLGPGSGRGGGGVLAVPFPIHIQALIGTVAVVWLFRIVGLVWLVTSVFHFLVG